MRISVIDCEGITERVGGTNRKKLTIVWIKKVHFLVFDTKSKQLDCQKTFNIKMPIPFNKLSRNAQKQWNYTHRIHECTWDFPGHDYEKVLSFITIQLKNVQKIYAKGKFLEERFLNDVGMYGSSIVQKDWIEPKKYPIIDLNMFGIEKFDHSLYRYMKMFQKSIENHGCVKNVERMQIVIYNYENGLPIPHDPQQECGYFLSKIIDKQLYLE